MTSPLSTCYPLYHYISYVPISGNYYTVWNCYLHLYCRPRRALTCLETVHQRPMYDERDRNLPHCVSVCVCVFHCMYVCLCLSVCPSEITWPLLSSVVGIISYTEYLFLLCVLTSMYHSVYIVCIHSQAAKC